MLYDRAAPVAGAWSLQRLNFVWWHLVFVGCQSGTCFM